MAVDYSDGNRLQLEQWPFCHIVTYSLAVIGSVTVVRIFLENDKVLAPQLTLYIKRENAFTLLSVRSVLTMKNRAKFHYLNVLKASSCLAINRDQMNKANSENNARGRFCQISIEKKTIKRRNI